MSAPVFKIEQQGCISVNDVDSCLESENIIALSIDLHTKWAETVGIMNSKKLFLGAGDRTIHAKEGADIDQDTLISFPKYSDFDIFIAQVSRYTLKLCLVRQKAKSSDNMYKIES